ncbi:ribonuclease H-like domain-containing protein [Tanacetum coccineum]
MEQANRDNRANHLYDDRYTLIAVSSNVNTVGQMLILFRQPVPTRTSNSFSPKRPQGNWGSAVKTSAGYNWRNSKPNSNCDSGPTFIRTDHPLKNMVDRGIFDSGCSGHMTGNKDQLEDFEEFNGGSVTFGGSKGYITGKGKIRVGNLDFDSVSFVKELGHFNLFSISQICDKQHKVLFTKTECLVVSSDFKMPDEDQILLKVPRHHNMYSFDMKIPSLTKDYACWIAKATCDESKLFSWVFFLASKDETSGILQNFIRQIENLLNHRNGVTERMNKTLIEAARTMLADSLLPTTFWAEAVSTACYIFNRCACKLMENLNEGFLVGYSLNCKAIGTSEKTNNAGTSQTPKSNASEEKDKDVELIVVPSAVQIPEEIVDSRTSSTKSKKEKIYRPRPKRGEGFLTDTLEE